MAQIGLSGSFSQSTTHFQEKGKPLITFDLLASGKEAARISNCTLEEMNAIAKWVQDSQCGKQVNPWTIVFRTEGEKMMFLLKWQ